MQLHFDISVHVVALSADARFAFDRLSPRHCSSVLTSRLYLRHKLQHSQSKRSLPGCSPPFQPAETMEGEPKGRQDTGLSIPLGGCLRTAITIPRLEPQHLDSLPSPRTAGKGIRKQSDNTATKHQATSNPRNKTKPNQEIA